ncbi:hypothetical protein Taro_017314 [Colocasia esculenta]|uniref:Uncharacterized protein n=1 Tax=Colocasia esculenta TaxID=4460 RepID=A0A843UR18_COLES|nr:hypothetical protein [Colocasia esculenta]
MLATWSVEDEDEDSQHNSGDDEVHCLMARSDDSTEASTIWTPKLNPASSDVGVNITGLHALQSRKSREQATPTIGELSPMELGVNALTPGFPMCVQRSCRPLLERPETAVKFVGVAERRPVRTSRDVTSGQSSRPRHCKVLYFPHRRLWIMEYSCKVWCKPCRRRLIPRQHSRPSWRLRCSR